MSHIDLIEACQRCGMRPAGLLDLIRPGEFRLLTMIYDGLTLTEVGKRTGRDMFNVRADLFAVLNRLEEAGVDMGLIRRILRRNLRVAKTWHFTDLVLDMGKAEEVERRFGEGVVDWTSPVFVSAGVRRVRGQHRRRAARMRGMRRWNISHGRKV